MKEFIVVWGGITVINDIPLPYLLKTSANQRFTDFFRGYKGRKLVENVLNGGKGDQ